MKTKLIILAFISIFAFACKKDNIAPAVSINSPASNAMTSGIVVLSGRVTDEHLVGMSIRVTSDESGQTLFYKQFAIDGLTSYAFSEQYDPGNVIVPANVTLSVEAWDKNDSKTTKTVKFTLAP